MKKTQKVEFIGRRKGTKCKMHYRQQVLYEFGIKEVTEKLSEQFEIQKIL